MSVKAFGSNEAVNEQTTAQYACTLTDAAGAAIDSGAVTAIVATLKDAADETVINGRSGQDVLGVNGGSLGPSGAFTLTLSTLDTIARGTQALQPRRLTLKATYTSGVITHEVHWYVRSLADIS